MIAIGKLPYRTWLVTVDVDVSYVIVISHSYLRYLRRILDTWIAMSPQSEGSGRSTFPVTPEGNDLVDDIRIARIDESDLEEIDGLRDLVGRVSANPEGVDITVSTDDLDALVGGDWAEWNGIGDVDFKLSRDGTARIMFADYNYCDVYEQRPYFVSLLINLSGVSGENVSGEASR